MKIKLAILESDVSYLKRIVSVFNTKFADKLEIYSFTDKEEKEEPYILQPVLFHWESGFPW